MKSIEFCSRELLQRNLKPLSKYALLVLLVVLPVISEGGGSGEPVTVFYRVHPSISELVQGKIYGDFNSRNSLGAVTAYLHLSGNFRPAHRRIIAEYSERSPVPYLDAEEEFRSALQTLGVDVGYIPVQKALMQRVTIGTRSFNRYSSYTNCQPDSFATATETLLARQQLYGADSESLARWINAQLQVFEHCSAEQFNPPSVADPSWRALEIHDRQYQIAATYFYSNQYLEAADLFRQIANTSDSPWQDLGRYLVARSLARQAIVNEIDIEENLNGALLLYRQMAQDSEFLSAFPSVSGQIKFLQARLDPLSARSEISRVLIEEPESASGETLRDYLFYMRLYRPQNDQPFDNTELGYWLSMAMNHSIESVESTIEHWQSTQSLPWLILVASKAGADTESSIVDELIQQLRNVRVDSAGYFVSLRHLIRLLQENGQAEEAFKLATSASEESQFDLGQKNTFKTLAAAASDSWIDYLTMSAIRPLELYWTDDYAKSLSGELFNLITRDSTLYSKQTVQYLNDHMTAPMMLEALDLTELSAYLRSRLAIAGWTKAMLSSDLDTALEFSAHIKAMMPRLAVDFEKFESSDDKQFEAAWIIITNPAFSPQLAQGFGRMQYVRESSGIYVTRPAPDFVALPSRRYNWWCAEDFDQEAWDQRLTHLFETDPKFRQFTERQLADIRSVKRLRTSSATQFFGPHILNYAEQNLDDPRIARALHRLVFATRHACSSGPGAISQRAYALLHRHFPDSEWATMTPYWFE